MVKVNIKVDTANIKTKVDRMIKQGQVALVNQVYADMNPYVPAKTYDLRNQSQVSLDSKAIIYWVPYARIQFYTQFQNYTTPGTGPRWDLKAQAIHGIDWQKVVKAAMK